jgi:hypothetical protein
MFGRNKNGKDANIELTNRVSETIDQCAVDGDLCNSPGGMPDQTPYYNGNAGFIRRDEVVDCFQCGALCWRFAVYQSPVYVDPVYVDDMQPSTKQAMANELVSIGKVGEASERHFCKLCRPAYDVIRLEDANKTRYFCFPKPPAPPPIGGGLVEVTESGKPLPKKRTAR